MLRVLRGEGILGTAISDLEEKVEAENDEVASENTKAYADIILKGDVIIECKCWVPGGISFDKFISGESGSYAQFKIYLGSNEVTTLANLKYWFDAKKIKLGGYRYATVFAKLKFQELFTAKAQDLYNFLGSIKFNNLFGAKTVEIFLSTHRHRRENFHIAHIL